MKTIPLRCAIALICCMAAVTGRADTLIAVPITITGTIYQGGGAKPEALTFKNMLTLFGSPSVNPSTVAYFYDESNSSYVLASKSQITIYGKVLTEEAGMAWDPSPTSTMEAGNCTGMNGNLAGTYREGDLNGKHHSVDSAGFLIWGVLNGTDTIINGALTAVFPH